MSINQRIEALRQEMKNNGLNAYIVPSSDAHQSEYVADHWKCREWISGFTGSAGTIVITHSEAGLWTDSRYFLQADTELSDTEIKLYKPKDRFAPEHIVWLADNLPQGSVVGVNGDLCTIGQAESYEGILKDAGIDLNTSHDLFEKVWSDRKAIPENVIFEHKIEYAGKSRTQKLDVIRQSMTEQNVNRHLVSTLDDIAWIFNIRGNDVDFNPVAVSYAIISQDSATIFINNKKVPEQLRVALKKDGVETRPYESITQYLNEIEESEIMLVDRSVTSVNIYKAINCKKKLGKTISRKLKAIKNETEIGHTRKVMAKDGAAIAETFYWLDNELKSGSAVSEADISDKLAANRSTMDNYIGESFPAIVGYKSNGAIIHYRPYHGKCAQLRSEGILLVDSGGQYLDGTTDITRTIALGTPTKEEKRNFTLVLKGNIALSKATFPQGTTGAQLDTLARMHLWEHGLNYGHGTGHGVGFFLNVHEPPQGFSGTNSRAGRTAHEVGMLTSNEPGFYKEDHYGIRIENLLVARKSDHEGFVEFETVTLYPIDIKLIDEAIFTKSEKAWLNKYHYNVLKKVSPYLKGDVLSWFQLKCRPMN